MSVDPRDFVDLLIEKDFDFFAGVPDSLLKNLSFYLSDSLGDDRHITAANEGSAVAMCCGYHLATGKFGVVYMQNSGEGNAVNPLVSLADPDVYSIPLLLVIGWRGEPGQKDEPQHLKQGKITCELLDVMDIPYCVMGEDWSSQVASLLAKSTREERPVALVVPKGSFKPMSASMREQDEPMMLREDALDAILSYLGEEDYIVSTTGKTSREVFEIREKEGIDHSHDFLTVGSMGYASSIAFGISLGSSSNVWCIDGDGAFIMHMGTLAVIAQNMPPNFKYIINNNGAHESVGGQKTIAREIDIERILTSFGFSDVFNASTIQEVEQSMEAMKKAANAALILNTCVGSRDDLGRPTTTPHENKASFMDALSHQSE